jgi:hypothetical protein
MHGKFQVGPGLGVFLQCCAECLVILEEDGSVVSLCSTFYEESGESRF